VNARRSLRVQFLVGGEKALFAFVVQ
jgi:hypothetical protein